MTGFGYSTHRIKVLLDLFMLYISKSGAIVVGIVVLPWYQQLMGSMAFGLVALLLSLQAFLLMLDLGMSTIVSRDLACSKSNISAITTLRAAQLVLHVAYFILLISAIVLGFLRVFSISILQLVMAVLFFWALIIQNIGQSALLARRKYKVAGFVQTIGVLVRASVTLILLQRVNASINIFLFAQTSTAILHMFCTLWFCNKALNAKSFPLHFRRILIVAKALIKRGAPLIIFGLAGAAVLQLDKTIISIFLSPSVLAPYYLASVLCLTPINVLAGPIVQYFQPRIVASINNHLDKDAVYQLKKLTMAIVCVVIIPSAFLWFFRGVIINIWLHNHANANIVAHYVSILLPGVAFGALGYIPYTILIAYQDYHAQARLSASMTFFTLLATVLCVVVGSIEGVCWVYAIYHALSTIISWLRSRQLQSKNMCDNAVV